MEVTFDTDGIPIDVVTQVVHTLLFRKTGTGYIPYFSRASLMVSTVLQPSIINSGVVRRAAYEVKRNGGERVNMPQKKWEVACPVFPGL
jgi:alpha-D-ribose 1-methylphosphonate 5-triphosphate synthase subunit PhnL